MDQGGGSGWGVGEKTHVRLLGQHVKGGEVDQAGSVKNSRETSGTARKKWRSGSRRCRKRTLVTLLGQLVKSGEVGQGGVGKELT